MPHERVGNQPVSQPSDHFRALNAKSIDELLLAIWGNIFNDIISLPAALVTILMIRGVDANQKDRDLILDGLAEDEESQMP